MSKRIVSLEAEHLEVMCWAADEVQQVVPPEGASRTKVTYEYPNFVVEGVVEADGRLYAVLDET